MNYIELINSFWRCDKERPISPSDTRLYFYLLNTCNELGWKIPFGHSDRHLSARLGMSVNTVREAKNRLKQLGLIDFTTPEKASKGLQGQTKFWLTVSNIDTVPDTVKRTTVSKSDTVRKRTVSKNDTDTDTVPDTVSDTVPDTNNKLNKTKQNIPDTIVSGRDQNSDSSSPEEKKKGSAQKRKDEIAATPHWEHLVKVWFDFYEEKNRMKPSFLGQDPKSLKRICDNLQGRATNKQLVWDAEAAAATLKAFLNYAYNEKWLRDNFLLPNLERQFDKIIANATKGNSTQGAMADALSRVDQMPD